MDRSVIKEVILHKLPEKGWALGSDRRGMVAQFILKYTDEFLSPGDYVVRGAVESIQDVIRLMGYSIRQPGVLGEQSECWINLTNDPVPLVWVNHKYWSQPQVDFFTATVRNLARLHGWQLKEL